MGEWSVVQPAASEWSVVPSEPAGPVPGTAEALGRGALQGVSLGFSDEITGALESIFSDKTYAQSRDEARAANAAASEAHPWAYGGAELAGGFAVPVPGLGAARAGAGALAHAGRAAVAGGIAGLGASEADLTRGGFGQAVSDTVSSALLGGAIGAVAGKIGQKLGKAGEAADDRAIRALAGGESKTSGAAWQKTRKMVNNPETRSILSEPVAVETEAGKRVTTSLERAAGKEPTAIREVVDAQVEKIGSELRPIYAQADAKNGGVSLAKYIQHLDDEIARAKTKPPTEAGVYVRAIEELKDNALTTWGARGEGNIRIPSDQVRAEATALQKIGFKTVDPLNPGLQTQVKRDMGTMVRNFVNDHVKDTLGDASHERLTSLNKRMNAWLGVGSVIEARAEKEAAGRISGRGLISELGSRGSMIGAGIASLASGSPLPLLAPLGAKALDYAPAAARGAARAAAGVDRRLQAVADAAAAGNPFAQRLLASVRNAPGGAARIAALERGGSPQAGVPEGPGTDTGTEDFYAGR